MDQNDIKKALKDKIIKRLIDQGMIKSELFNSDKYFWTVKFKQDKSSTPMYSNQNNEDKSIIDTIGLNAGDSNFDALINFNEYSTIIDNIDSLIESSNVIYNRFGVYKSENRDYQNYISYKWVSFRLMELYLSAYFEYVVREMGFNFSLYLSYREKGFSYVHGASEYFIGKPSVGIFTIYINKNWLDNLDSYVIDIAYAVKRVFAIYMHKKDISNYSVFFYFINDPSIHAVELNTVVQGINENLQSLSIDLNLEFYNQNLLYRREDNSDVKVFMKSILISYDTLNEMKDSLSAVVLNSDRFSLVENIKHSVNSINLVKINQWLKRDISMSNYILIHILPSSETTGFNFALRLSSYDKNNPDSNVGIDSKNRHRPHFDYIVSFDTNNILTFYANHDLGKDRFSIPISGKINIFISLELIVDVLHIACYNGNDLIGRFNISASYGFKVFHFRSWYPENTYSLDFNVLKFKI